jgi:hypothetical protein
MDKGRPFRVPQPADRRVISKPEPTYRQPEASQPEIASVPQVAPTVEPSMSSRRAQKGVKAPKRRWFWPLTILIIVLALVGGWFAWSQFQNGPSAIDSSKYQAVFFTNGQVYFGKLHQFNHEQLKLTDIYYLQTQTGSGTDSKNPQQTSSDQSNVQLIKLGNEIHGPEDEMIISKDQVLFYENLKPDGKVAQSISKYKTPN